MSLKEINHKTKYKTENMWLLLIMCAYCYYFHAIVIKSSWLVQDEGGMVLCAYQCKAPLPHIRAEAGEGGQISTYRGNCIIHSIPEVLEALATTNCLLKEWIII